MALDAGTLETSEPPHSTTLGVKEKAVYLEYRIMKVFLHGHKGIKL